MFKLNKINIFSQTKIKRTLVGALWRDGAKFYFAYEKSYTRQKNAIPLGPEFDLWKEKFSSKSLFPSLADRLPAKQNPAYKDYCAQWGIDPAEDDPFVLLTTIGRRGPSTFVFESAIDEDFTPERLLAFRKRLKLTQRDFGLLLGLSHPTLLRLEQGRSTNETLLTYLKLVESTPAALQWLLKTRGQYLHDDVVDRCITQ